MCFNFLLVILGLPGNFSQIYLILYSIKMKLLVAALLSVWEVWICRNQRLEVYLASLGCNKGDFFVVNFPMRVKNFKAIVQLIPSIITLQVKCLCTKNDSLCPKKWVASIIFKILKLKYNIKIILQWTL